MHRAGLNAPAPEPELAVMIADVSALDAAHEPLAGRSPGRVHFGNEFCERLLFTEPQLERALTKAEVHGLELSVVLPYVTERTYHRATRLLRHLAQARPGTEIVCNDWGLLRFVSGLEALTPVMGRALNRTLVDPRVPEHLAPDLSPEALAALRGEALGSAAFSSFFQRYRVRRVEADLSPLGHEPESWPHAVPVSLHLPYTFVASGRVCLFAGLGRVGVPPGRRFAPGPCRYECSRYELELGAPPGLAGRLPLVQRGNTVFARHDGSLDALLARVGRRVDRVIWSPTVPMGGGPAC